MAPEPSTSILTFYLGAEEYGLPLVQAREILGMLPPTPLPKTAAHVLGLINLRGEILPVFDLHRLFQLQSQPAIDSQACILIAETRGESFGLRVDGVHQVLNLPAASIDPPSEAMKARSAAIDGLGRIGQRLIILLDLQALFPEETLTGAA